MSPLPNRILNLQQQSINRDQFDESVMYEIVVVRSANQRFLVEKTSEEEAAI